MATELVDGVWWFSLRGANVYFVEDDVPTLVDAGTPFDVGGIEAELEAAGYAIEDVERVLLTHYDLDHVGTLGRLDLDAVVRIGGADAPLLTGERRPPWSNHKGALQRVSTPLLRTPDQPVEPIEDGEEVGSFRAYHTPGHTPGHTVFVSEALSAAFLGDLVFGKGRGLVSSPWVVSYDTATVEESIRTFAERAPPFEALGMGHGVPFVRDGDGRLADLAAGL